MSSIVLESVTKNFGDVEIISNLNLSINSEEFIVFVGPSGCGKSTMLRMIAGLEEVSSGNIFIDENIVNKVAPSKRGVSMVFQNYALYPHMTVAENMGFGLRMTGSNKQQTKQLVDQVAETLQITRLLGRYPKQLSGGQRQRVAIGRAIVRRPKVFLFDEPLSNLDASLRVQMRIELAKLHHTLKTTMIYVTHDQTEAMTLGDRIVVFNEGRIEQVGTPLELYQFPHNIFVAEFLGTSKINVMNYHWDSDKAQIILQGAQGTDTLGITEKAQFKALEKGTKIAVRPENVKLASNQSGMPAKIDFIETLGDISVVYVTLKKSGEKLTLKVPPKDAEIAVGDEIWIVISPESLLVYDANDCWIKA